MFKRILAEYRALASMQEGSSQDLLARLSRENEAKLAAMSAALDNQVDNQSVVFKAMDASKHANDFHAHIEGSDNPEHYKTAIDGHDKAISHLSHAMKAAGDVPLYRRMIQNHLEGHATARGRAAGDHRAIVKGIAKGKIPRDYGPRNVTMKPLP